MSGNPERPVLDAIDELVDWQLDTGRSRADGPESAPPVWQHERTYLYQLGIESIAFGGIDWAADDIKVMLCTAAYQFATAHRCLSDVTDEIRGIGYQQGGKPVAGRTVTEETDSDGTWTVMSARDVVWEGSTISANRAVVYRDTGDPQTSLLICCVLFDVRPSRYGTYRLMWSPSGIIRLLRQ